MSLILSIKPSEAGWTQLKRLDSGNKDFCFLWTARVESNQRTQALLNSDPFFVFQPKVVLKKQSGSKSFPVKKVRIWIWFPYLHSDNGRAVDCCPLCKVVSLNKISSQYIKLALSPCHNIYVVPNPRPLHKSFLLLGFRAYWLALLWTEI